MQQITRGYQIFGQSDSDWSHTWTKSSAVVLAVLFHCPWMGNRANPVESPHGTWIPSDKILLVYPTVWWSSSKLYHPINSLINSFGSHRLGGYGRWWILWNISSAKGSASRKNGRVCGRIGRIGRKGRMRRSVAKRQKKSCISNCNCLETRKHIVMSIGFSQEFAAFAAVVDLRIRPVAHQQLHKFFASDARSRQQRCGSG